MGWVRCGGSNNYQLPTELGTNKSVSTLSLIHATELTITNLFQTYMPGYLSNCAQQNPSLDVAKYLLWAQIKMLTVKCGCAHQKILRSEIDKGTLFNEIGLTILI